MGPRSNVRSVPREPTRGPLPGGPGTPNGPAGRGNESHGTAGPRCGWRGVRTPYVLSRLLMIWIAPGPMMTTNSAGRMHRISGKTIFTGVCCALASAA
jgi:hypothetical protein